MTVVIHVFPCPMFSLLFSLKMERKDLAALHSSFSIFFLHSDEQLTLQLHPDFGGCSRVLQSTMHLLGWLFIKLLIERFQIMVCQLGALGSGALGSIREH